MEKIFIICVEDQREVLNAVLKDLESFEPVFALEGCESAGEAAELLDEIDAKGNYVGLMVCDHVMPGKSGVELLIEVHRDPRFAHTKKLLLTGLATHQDTINAINNAAIDRYMEKPWDVDTLQTQARTLLTQFIFDQGIGYEKYLKYLDQEVVLERVRKGG
jgi:two-component system, chemotaxis family, chemotaxis protein CheY